MILRPTWVPGVVLGALALAGCAGEDAESVATFREGKIAAAEFKSRYQMYLDKTGQRDNIVLRKEILNNAINERLMVRDLQERGFEDLPETKERLEQIRLQAVLDRYSRRISVDTLTVSEQELWNEFRAYNSRASARYLYARSEKEAWDLRNRLEQGATFEELARTVFEDPGLATNGGYLGSFGWGDMETSLEEVAFGLPVGQISDPFPLGVGYGILKVETRVEQPLASEYDYAKAKEKLRRAIVDRKTDRLINDVAHRVARDVEPVFDELAPELVLNYWDGLLGTVTDPEKRVPEDVLARHLVSFKGGSWTISDFGGKVQRTSERQRKRVATLQDVKDVVTGLIVRDELLSRAMSANLDDDPQVLSQVASASLAFRLKSWRDIAEDPVEISGWNEKALQEEFEMNKGSYAHPAEVDVAEILVRTRGEAGQMIRLLNGGSDFGSVARRHSIRLWAAKQGGELGFGTKASFGVLGEKFFGAKVGQLLGPEFVDPYYGVFKILNRREERPKTYEEARQEIVQAHEIGEKQKAFKKGMEALRARADIHVDMDALANIVTDNKTRERAL